MARDLFMDSSKQLIIGLALCAAAWLVVVSGIVGDAKDGPSQSNELTEYARKTLDDLQARSFKENREFCGVIYRTGMDQITRSRIFIGDESSCDFEWEETPVKIALASFHTHGSWNADYDSEAPSIQDLETDINSKVLGYISTPGGRLWALDWDTGTATIICGEGCLAKDPNYRPCNAFPPQQSYSLDELRERVNSDKGEC
jgi:hypothetical protein